MLTEKGIIPVKGGQLKVLTNSQIEELHQAVIEVLENIGIKMHHDMAREIMESNGCEVNHDNRLVKIPGSVLMKFIDKVPKEITMYARDPKLDIHFDDLNNVYVMGGVGGKNILDIDGNYRKPTMRDLEDLTRLEDSLEYMDIQHFLVEPDDEFGEYSESEMLTFAHLLTHSRRNFYSLIGGCKEGLEYQIEMASVLTGSKEEFLKRPFFTVGICAISPLLHREEFIEELLACGQYKIPCYIETDPSAGATTPFTMAGTIVENTANILAGVVLLQMAYPGSPCIFSTSVGIFDMKYLNFAGSTPESTLMHMALAQMAHFYGLPYYGGNTPDSKLPDAQMGYERAQHFLGQALGGVNIIHIAIGALAAMRLANYEQCVIDNEILGATFRIIQGIEINKDTIGIDSFKEAMDGDGNFIGTKHTLKYLRSKERWEPRLTDRGNWNQWMANTNGKDMRERAKDLVFKILKEHNPIYATEKQKDEIFKLSKEAQKVIMEKRRIK